MSPPVAARRGEICGTDASPATTAVTTPWAALDYSGCGTGRGEGCAGPAIRVRRAAHSFGHPRVTRDCHARIDLAAG